MLLAEMARANVALQTGIEIVGVDKAGERYRVTTSEGAFEAPALVIATGGKSIPKMGATGFAYKIAEQFGLRLIETRPALVPSRLSRDCWPRYRNSRVFPVRSKSDAARPCSARPCCSRIVGSPARQFCRSPPCGVKAIRSASAWSRTSMCSAR